MFTQILVILLSILSVALAYQSDFVFPDSQESLDFSRRMNSNFHTQPTISTSKVTKKTTKIPTTTEAFPTTTESSLNTTKELFEGSKTQQQEDENINTGSGELAKADIKSLDSRNIFDLPCKPGYKRNNSGVCRKVYRK